MTAVSERAAERLDPVDQTTEVGGGIVGALANVWARPLWAGLAAFLLYAAAAQAHHPLLQATDAAYYNYLADALLHGQLHLRQVPPQTLDLVHYHGQYFLYWGPLPAVLLMPFVALFGVGFSDVLTAVVVGAVNVALVAAILAAADARGLAPLTAGRRAILVAFFALGTVHLTLAPLGRVWALDQLVGFLFVALAYLAVLRLRGWAAFVLTGAALAGAVLTRDHLVLAGVWPAWYLASEHWGLRWRGLVARLAAAGAPIVAAVGLLGVYDWARFGSALDNGIPYHLMNVAFRADYARYGFFSLHYVPINLYYQYVFYPFPLRPESAMGGSLVLMSPVFALGLVGVWLGRRQATTWALVGAIVLVNVPILLLMGTGWMQYGPRYTLDFTVPLLLLTAMGSRRVPVWTLLLLAAASILQYSGSVVPYGRVLDLLR